MTQYIIAGLIIIAAAFYLIFTLVKKAQKEGCSCSGTSTNCQDGISCQCDNCSLKQSCSKNRKQ